MPDRSRYPFLCIGIRSRIASFGPEPLDVQELEYVQRRTVELTALLVLQGSLRQLCPTAGRYVRHFKFVKPVVQIGLRDVTEAGHLNQLGKVDRNTGLRIDRCAGPVAGIARI